MSDSSGTSPSSRRVLTLLGIGMAFSLLGDATLYTVLPSPAIAAQAGVTLAMVGILLGVNRAVRYRAQMQLRDDMINLTVELVTLTEFTPV